MGEPPTTDPPPSLPSPSTDSATGSGPATSSPPANSHVGEQASSPVTSSPPANSHIGEQASSPVANFIGIDLGTTTTLMSIYNPQTEKVEKCSLFNDNSKEIIAPSTIAIIHCPPTETICIVGQYANAVELQADLKKMKGGSKWHNIHIPATFSRDAPHKLIQDTKRFLGRDTGTDVQLLGDVLESDFELLCRAADWPSPGPPPPSDIYYLDMRGDIKKLALSEPKTICHALDKKAYLKPLLEMFGDTSPGNWRAAAQAFVDEAKTADVAARLQRLGLRFRPIHRPSTLSGGKSPEPIQPEELCALLLRHCRHRLMEMHGELYQKCMITIPANFSDTQRLATINAATIAGWEAVHLVNEPTAAAVAYIHRQDLEDGKYMVADLGGGTLDISMLDVKKKKKNGLRTFVVESTNGDDLGGAHFTTKLVDIAKAKLRKSGVKLVGPAHKAPLRDICEKAKKSCQNDRFDISFGKHTISVSQQEWLDECEELWRRIRELAKETLERGDTELLELKGVILAGGASRTRGFQTAVETGLGLTGDMPLIYHADDPDCLCAEGAAYIAASKFGVTEITARPLGIDTADKNNKSGNMSRVVKLNTALPFTTSQQYQLPKFSRAEIAAKHKDPLKCKISIFEGTADKVAGNLLLGTFAVDLNALESLRQPIEVRFHVDEERVVTVTAAVPSKGRTISRELKVSRKSRFTSKELSTMIARCAKFYPVAKLDEKAENEDTAVPKANEAGKRPAHAMGTREKRRKIDEPKKGTKGST